MLHIIQVMSTAMNSNINLQAEHTNIINYIVVTIVVTSHAAFPEQQTILGSSVALPCEITAPGMSTDSVTLILWYRGDDISGAPIYSIDARSRNTPLESAKHFIADELAGRATFDISVRPALLRLSPIVDSDSGQYWCRVDFRWTRTTISNVMLNVVVPPKRVIIRDESGIELKSIAVFDEGSDVQLFCESIAGNPLATITWYRNNRKLTKQTVMIRDNSTVVSGITLDSIARGDINAVIKCHAANSELTKPVVKSITIDINLRPLKAVIVSLNKDRLTAGRKLEAICHTYGSRPAAVIAWFIGDKKLTSFKDTHLEGNGTKSIVTFVPTPEDNGLDLRCRAENPKLSNSAAEDRINLDVKFMPNVTLVMGSGNNDDVDYSSMTATVNESNEILLECNVSSNPKPTRIRWLFNRKELIQDVAKGIIIGNSTLIIKNTRRESEGRYQCVAYNSEGRGDSGELFVQVFFAPKCVSQQRIIETSLSFPTNIFCEVDANPENVTFVWQSANIEDRHRVMISSKALRSKLTIIPQFVTDFGTYTCWAYNTLGSNQLIPCVFNVTAGGHTVPKPVTDCDSKAVDGWVYIKCQHSGANAMETTAPIDGTAQQLFVKDTYYHLEVQDSQTNRKVIQLNNSEPVFNVSTSEWLPIYYQLIVYVSNPFGVSEEVTMMVQPELPSLKAPSSAKAAPIAPNLSQHQQTTDQSSSHRILVILISLLTVVLVILSVLITVTIVLCIIRQKNNKRKRHNKNSKCHNNNTGSGGGGGGANTITSDCDQYSISGNTGATGCSSSAAGSRSATLDRNSMKRKVKHKGKSGMSQTKASNDSIATSDGSGAHPDVIPCDGVIYYGGPPDHHLIDDISGNHNSLPIYRDIIIATANSVGAYTVLNDTGGQLPANEQQLLGMSRLMASQIVPQQQYHSKTLLANHVVTNNHVSVINDRLNGPIDGSIGGAGSVGTVMLVHNSQQPLDTFVAKYPANDGTNDTETTDSYLQLSASYPQTTPV